MGKGYNNYMCKKPFHPGSKANIKRAWMAEQKQDNEKKKQEDMRLQYEKEQDLYTNKALVSTESKDKLALNFMYEAPPGAKREHQKEDDEPEYKFEWQRKFNAPREDFAKDNKDIRDQPFGIPVRNVRCIKCHKWGHLNTDRECSLFNQASKNAASGSGIDPLDLMKLMRADGLALKKEVLGHHFDLGMPNQQLISSDEEEDPEMAFLKTLSTKQKKKLLRKLDKLAKKQESEKTEKERRKKKTKKKRKHQSSSSDSDSAKTKHKKSKKRREESSSEDSVGHHKRKRKSSSHDHKTHKKRRASASD